MMDDRYLSRGKQLMDGAWSIGYLNINEHYHYIEYPVDPSTIGQCTGLKDKHGKLISRGIL